MIEGEPPFDDLEPKKRGLRRRALGALGNKARRTARRARKPLLRYGTMGLAGIIGVVGAKQVIEHPSEIANLGKGAIENVIQLPGAIEEKYSSLLQTSDQRHARNLLESLSETDELEQEGRVVRNLVVGPDGANLRNSPHPDPSEPNQIGWLEPGTVIPVAIQVEGEIYRIYDKQPEGADWYTFLDPNDPDRAVFSYSGNFEEDQ